MNKFLARIGIVFVSIYILLVIINAWNGVSLHEYNSFLGHSLIFDLILLFMCYDDEKYFCKYMRFQCYNFIFTDLVIFIDGKYKILDVPEYQLIILSVSWGLAFLITLILAINHFRRVRKLNKQKSRFREYEIRR